MAPAANILIPTPCTEAWACTSRLLAREENLEFKVLIGFVSDASGSHTCTRPSFPPITRCKAVRAMHEISGDSVWMIRIGSMLFGNSALRDTGARISHSRTVPVLVPAATNRPRRPGMSDGDAG